MSASAAWREAVRQGGLCSYLGHCVRTNFYIDGFNFYYGAVKDTPYKWLDFGRFFHLVFPKNQINRIRYFTALVRPRPNDPQQLQRQQTFIRALETIPGFSVHYGIFLSNPRRMALVKPPTGGPRTVEVLATQEKGSDVNLATYLIFDALDNDYETAVVVSNDSDLALPIRLVRERLHRTVGLLNPHANQSKELSSVADFHRPVRKGVLAAAQFPVTLQDAAGTIHKPAGW